MSLAISSLYKQALANKNRDTWLQAKFHQEKEFGSLFFEGLLFRYTAFHIFHYCSLSASKAEEINIYRAHRDDGGPTSSYRHFPPPSAGRGPPRHSPSQPRAAPVPQPPRTPGGQAEGRAAAVPAAERSGGRGSVPGGGPLGSLTWTVMSKGVTPSPSDSNMALEASTKKMRLSRPENL